AAGAQLAPRLFGHQLSRCLCRPLPKPGRSYFQSNSSVWLAGASACLPCHFTRSSCTVGRRHAAHAQVCGAVGWRFGDGCALSSQSASTLHPLDECHVESHARIPRPAATVIPAGKKDCWIRRQTPMRNALISLLLPVVLFVPAAGPQTSKSHTRTYSPIGDYL